MGGRGKLPIVCIEKYLETNLMEMKDLLHLNAIFFKHRIIFIFMLTPYCISPFYN